MTGRGRELAGLMERRKVGVLSVQETRWKGTRRNSWEEAASCYVVGQISKGEMEWDSNVHIPEGRADQCGKEE